MNLKIRMGVGILCFVLGGIYFINAMFIGEANDWQDAVLTRIVYLSIMGSFFGAGYYLVLRKKEIKTVNI